MHTQRVADLLLTLKFDRFLYPRPDKTYIFYGPQDLDLDLDQMLNEHNIDTSTFEIMPDRHMWNNRALEVDIYQFGGWIGQQLIKFLSLDLVDYQDCVLIQDCDTFNVQPYTWITNNCPQLYVRENTDHSVGYYEYVKKFTGQERQVPHCFVSEFMPVLKTDWIELKNQIESIYQQSWLTAMHGQFVVDSAKHRNPNPLLPPIWFSEYELLGNWAVYKNPKINLVPQKRFDLTHYNKNKITTLTDFNCVCNSGAITLNEVDEFANYINRLILTH